jgi:uncharacterized membrane protein YhaH (DUF805 family)
MRTAKAWVAAVGAVVTALTAALSDDVFNVDDTVQVIVTMVPIVATLVSTYAVPNKHTVTAP